MNDSINITKGKYTGYKYRFQTPISYTNNDIGIDYML